jgi:hypothetical protein
MGTVVAAAGRKTREAGELAIMLGYLAWCWAYLGTVAGGWTAQRAYRRATGQGSCSCSYEECDRCGRRSARPRGAFTP